MAVQDDVRATLDGQPPEGPDVCEVAVIAGRETWLVEGYDRASTRVIVQLRGEPTMLPRSLAAAADLIAL